MSERKASSRRRQRHGSNSNPTIRPRRDNEPVDKRKAHRRSTGSIVQPVVQSILPKTKTFRDLLVGTLTEFLKQECMTCPETMDGLVHLVVALARYREEGVPLYPRLVICDEPGALSGLLQGRETIELGLSSRNSETMRDALKKCALLAKDQWVAYILREKRLFRYGVFRQASAPTAVSLRDTIYHAYSTSDAETGGLLLISQVAENIVELVGARGSPLTIHLSAAPDDQVSPHDTVDRLVLGIVSRVRSKTRDPCASFLRNLFVDALRQGHGALVAVVNKDREPKVLGADCVRLAQPLDIASAVDEYVGNPTDQTLSRLRDYASLVEGMLCSDGITVFHSDARVTAFRAFIKAKESASKSSLVSGGARHRAFRELCRLVDEKQIGAAFIRSMDGASAIHEDGVHGQ